MEVSQQQNEDAPVKLTKTTDEATGLVSQVKKACSPSPPLVLIQTVDEQQQQQQKQQQEKPVATNNNSMKATTTTPQMSASLASQQLALIEAADPTELELVMRLITERFPSVKINFFQKSKDDKAKQLDKNNLTTENGNRRLSASSIRQSIDGSGLLSHMMAIERQESRDSGFWSVSKCSFESMKSLSLTDSHATSSTSPSNNGNVKQQHHQHNHQQANENKSSSPVESTNSNGKSPSNNLVLKSPEVDDQTSNKMEETTSMELTNPSNQDETSTAMNDDENNNKQNENNNVQETAANNETTSTMQRTESAGSSSNKPTMHNWTKWKKGQALRYASSSSNTSQYDATSSLDSNPPTHQHHQPTSHHHLYTANVLCASSSFDSSYASAGAESSSLSMAGHCFNYSNSFDSPAVASAASTLSLNPNHLQTMSSSAIASQWSASTSRLDSIKIGSGSNGVSNNGENKSAQKRRGKLVRDRTIDNADEHLASHHHSHMVNKVNIMMGNANGLRMSGEINRISSSSAKECHDNQGVQQQQQQQQQKDEGVGLLSLSRNGRISPPEKRITKMSVSHQDVGSSETPQFDFSSLSAGGNEMHHMKKKPTLLSSSPHSLVSSRRTSYRSQHDSSSSHSKNSFSSSLSTTPPPACSTPSSSAILPGINERATNLGASGSSSLSSSPSPSSSAQQDNNVSPSSSSINPTNLEIYRDLQSKLSIRAGTESDEHSDAKIAAQTNLLSLISHFSTGNNRPGRSNTEEGNLLNVGNNHTMSSSNRNQQLTVNSSSVKQPMCRSSSSPNYPTNPQHHHHHGMNMPYNNPFPTIYSSPVTSNSSTYGLDQQSQANGRFLGGANSLTTSMSASPIYPTPFKSISCSIPITQPPPHAPFNLHQHPPNAPQFNPAAPSFLGYNNSLAAAAAAAAATIPFFNPFNKQLTMPPHPSSYHARSPAEFGYRDNNGNSETGGMMSRPPILNNKPPEIVITESKSENSIAEYDQSQNSVAAAAANFMSLVAANFEHQNMFRDGGGGGAKNENEVNKFGPSLLLPTEHANSKSPLNIFEDWSNLVNRNIKSPLLDGKQASPGAASATSGSSSSTAAGAKAVKPHVCTSCQKRFARSDMLIRHSRLHSGVRPYRCNRCGQEFSRSDHLNTHLRTHTGEKPYSCPHPKCTYAACRKDMITRHLKVHNKTRISLSFDNASTSASSNVNGLSMGSMDAASSYSFLPHSAAASFDATTTTTTTTSPIPFSTSCSNSNPSPASNDDYKRVSSDIKNETSNISQRQLNNNNNNPLLPLHTVKNKIY